MTDRLATAAARLAARRKSRVTRSVTYSRGDASVTVSVSVGETTWEVIDSEGFTTKWESRDFIMTAADLVLSGSTVLPARGDRIVETDDTAVYTYEAMAPASEPVYRFSDRSRVAIRIHTKLVDRTEA